MLKEENYPHLENIAELLWLSKFTGMQSLVREEVKDEKSQEPNPKPEIEGDEVEEDEPNIEPEEEEEQEDDLEVHTDNQEDNTSSSKQKSAKAIQSPKKLALDHYREWEKAFKFINLKTASKNRYELDEEKTVENIASTKVFDLVFKRVEEKSFFLTLVIDQGETMELWSELIKNFEHMLMTMGVFSRITIYYWDTKKEKPILHVDKALKREASEKLVVIDGQRNLVWVMSDCIASSWKSGEAFKSIDRWATKSFTSILQMFPKEMWMGTMLFKGKHIRLSSNSFNPINKKLKIKPSKREKNALKIPIISFDPYALQAWAKVVVNSKDNSISGIELDSLDFGPLKTPLKKEITSEMRMQRFYSQASPTAQKLAFYMSVLPVDFQVTRILQEERLPKSNQAHVAEVFLGGLIERRKKAKDIYYDFYPKVREELNANISADESFEIMSDMSNFVSSHLGIGFDFKALLADPNGAFEGEFALSEKSLAYAKLASQVLKRKGGILYSVAKRIDEQVNNKVLENEFYEMELDRLRKISFEEEIEIQDLDDSEIDFREDDDSDDNLAKLYMSKGEYNKAEFLYKKILLRNRGRCGVFDLSTVTSYFDLAVLYDDKKDFEKAYHFMKKTINLYSKISNENNANLLYFKERLKKIKEELLKRGERHKLDYNVTFNCKNCMTSHGVNCCQLVWTIDFMDEIDEEEVCGYEAIENIICDECNNEIEIHFFCLETSSKEKNSKGVSSVEAINLKGDCCPEKSLIKNEEQNKKKDENFLLNINIMQEWFYENYEDSANALLYKIKEGAYQYINGEPIVLEEVLFEKFKEEYLKNTIEEAIEKIKSKYGDIEWSPIPQNKDAENILNGKYKVSTFDDIMNNVKKKYFDGTIEKYFDSPIEFLKNPLGKENPDKLRKNKKKSKK